MSMNVTDLDRKLALLKRQWDIQTDPVVRQDLSGAASELRAQGANEAVANFLASGNISGGGQEYSRQYIGGDYSAAKSYAQSLIDTPKPAAAEAPKMVTPGLSADASALLAQIRSAATRMPTADDIMNSSQFKSLTDAVASRRDDQMRQANAQLAARGVLGEGSTPAASRLGWVYADAARKEQELIPALLQAETARQQAGYTNLINALGAQMGAEGQMFGQGLSQFQAETPYTNLTAAQVEAQRQAQVGEQQWRDQQLGRLSTGELTLSGREMVLAEKSFDADLAASQAKASAGISGNPKIESMTAAQLTTYMNSMNSVYSNANRRVNDLAATGDRDSDAYKAAVAEADWAMGEIRKINAVLSTKGNTGTGDDDWTTPSPSATGAPSQIDQGLPPSWLQRQFQQVMGRNIPYVTYSPTREDR